MIFIEFASRIIEMVRLDQEMRTHVPDVLGENQKNHWHDVDSANSAELKRIVLAMGWPTPEKVGEEAAEGAWLIVQHADHDISFQKYCLQVMTSHVSDVPPWQFAYLYD